MMKTIPSVEQMELTFKQAAEYKAAVKRQRRVSRAQWWFERMRQAVDRALDWQPEMPAKPEQTWLAYR